MAALAIFSLMGVIAFLLEALFLFIGLRLTQSPRATARRVVGATLLLNFVGIPASVVRIYFFADAAAAYQVAFLAFVLLLIALQVFILFRLFRATLGKAILTWLFAQIPALFSLLIALLLIRPFLLEAYVVPTNGMAPTILGTHQTGVCPSCGGDLILDPPMSPSRYAPPDSTGICTRCWKTSTVPTSTLAATVGGDRILVAKCLTPRRWDIIAYKDPKSGETYTKRLLGLPHEQISFADGKLLVDGKPIPLPPDLPNLTYPPLPAPYSIFGRPEDPTALDASHYFVVGDHAQNSLDSRSTGPIPTENCIGVVTWTYAPLSRARLFR